MSSESVVVALLIFYSQIHKGHKESRHVSLVLEERNGSCFPRPLFCLQTLLSAFDYHSSSILEIGI